MASSSQRAARPAMVRVPLRGACCEQPPTFHPNRTDWAYRTTRGGRWAAPAPSVERPKRRRRASWRRAERPPAGAGVRRQSRRRCCATSTGTSAGCPDRKYATRCVSGGASLTTAEANSSGPTPHPLDELVDTLRPQALAGNPAIVHQYRLALAAQADAQHAAPRRDLGQRSPSGSPAQADLQALEPFPEARSPCRRASRREELVRNAAPISTPSTGAIAD